MKIIIIGVLLFFGTNCTSLKKTEAKLFSFKEIKTFVLVQVDSISLKNKQIFFTPIQSYSSQFFKPIEIDSNITKQSESIFYKNLLSNSFREGVLEITLNKIIKIKHRELYLLSINILESHQEKLVIDDYIKPNTIDISKLTSLKNW